MIKVKLSLTPDKSLGHGHIVFCCGKRQPIRYEDLCAGEWWECVDCNKPLLLATETGYFVIGEQVTF